MSTIAITILDHLTLSDTPLRFNFPHTLTSHQLCQDEEATDKALQGQSIAVTNKVRITRELIQRHPELKMIAVAATGYNIIDIDAARAADVIVTNVAGYSTYSVAEHALMLMLNLSHRLVAYHDKVKAGQWQRSNFFSLQGPGYHQLTDKTLTLVGYGAISQAVAKLAAVFGMRIVLAGRKGTKNCPAGYTEFNTAIRQADILSLHCPLNAETQDLIGHQEIESMKPGAILINVSRGGLVNEQAVAEALRNGHLGGAGFDVLSTEPPAADNPLVQPEVPNLLVTPHVAWRSEEAMVTLLSTLERQITEFVITGKTSAVWDK